MCGIVGIAGKHDVAPVILEALRRLEYRGYDSAGIATLHDIADIGEVEADPAGDRRPHMSKLDVELRRLQGALGLRFRRARGLQRLTALIDGGIRDRLALVQDQPAIEVAFRQFDSRPRIGELAVRLFGYSLERARINHIEQVSGMDQSAVAKHDGGDEAAHLGPDLNLLDRLESSGKFFPLGDDAFDGLRDGD